MNEHFQLFQNITESIEQLIEDEQKSKEIKESAVQLRGSMQPIFQEFRQSATKLNQLLSVCSEHLNYSEKVWLSKPRIVQLSKPDILEKLGELSAQVVRIEKLRKKCKTEIQEIINQGWEAKVRSLKSQWFAWDSKKEKFTKDSLNVFERDGFFKEARSQLNFQQEELTQVLRDKLKPIYKELDSIQLKFIQDLIEALDIKRGQQIKLKIESTIQRIDEKFGNPTKKIPVHYLQEYQQILKNPVNILASKSMLGVSLADFDETARIVDSILVRLIDSICDHLSNLAIESLEEVMSFYSQILELQDRYQQETPEQRDAERFWIEQQRQRIAEIEKGLKVILSSL